MATRSLSAPKTCKYPGCDRPRYKEKYGLVHDFCGRTHANMYQATLHNSSPTYHSPIPLSTSTHNSQLPTTYVATSSASSSKPKLPKAIRNLKLLPSKLTSSSKNEIKFYNSYEPYYEFTNFYPAFINVDGKVWATSEHYFQAQKFIGTPYVEAIRKLPSAREAFQFSRDPAVVQWRRSDWDQVKDDVMLKVLRCKFEQDARLHSLLLGTGEKKLIEHTQNDSYWGDGGGGGLNRLGNLLMQVRGELKEKSKKPKATSPLKRSSSFSVPSTKSKHKHKDDTTISSKPVPNPGLAASRRRSGSTSDLSSTRSALSASYNLDYGKNTARATPPSPMAGTAPTHYAQPRQTSSLYSHVVSTPGQSTSKRVHGSTRNITSHTPANYSPRHSNDSSRMRSLLSHNTHV